MSLELEQAIIEMLEGINPIDETCIQMLEQASGYVAAQEVFAQIDLPPFNRSPLDGYAYKSEDTSNTTAENPVALKVIDTVYAGGFSKKSVTKGTAIRIMTGAPIPEGADCVIRQEDTDYGEDAVKIYKIHNAFDNFCYMGEDIKSDSLLIKKGEKINYSHIGILASQGMESVLVYRKARVTLITTGDELIDINKPLSEGKIYNSNMSLLRQRLKDLAVEVVAVHIGDDADAVCNFIRKNYENTDLFITTGGVSVGVKDIMHDVIATLPSVKKFWGLNLKPGSPVLYSVFKDTPILSLSGNPFAAYATFELLARPLLAKMSRDEILNTKDAEGIATTEFLKESKGRRIIRGKFENGKVILPAKGHESGSIYSMIGCNCLIDIKAGTKAIHVGDAVKVILL